MGGIDKTIRKLTPKEIMSPAGKKVDKEVERTWQSLNPKMPTAEDEKVIPLPDEEELERQRRRKNRGGGRASTVLTSDDQGLGG